jgi:hypothetical protein
LRIALQFCWNHGIRYAVDTVDSWEIDTDCSNLYLQFKNSMPFSTISRGNIEGYELHCQRTLVQDEHSSVLQLGGPTCVNVSYASKNKPKSLHGPKSRCAFPLAAGLKILQRKFGILKTASVVEQVQCARKQDEEELTSLFGQFQAHSASDYGAKLQRTRHFRISPHCKAYLITPFRIGAQEAGGYTWPAGPYDAQLGNFGPTLARYHPTLVERLSRMHILPAALSKDQFKKDKRYTSYEKKCLRQMLCQDTQSVGDGLCHMPAVFAASTLMYPPQLITRCSRPQCGKLAYCRECFNTMQVLGNSWHLGSAVTSIVSALITLRYNKYMQLNDVKFAFPEKHDCGDSCTTWLAAIDEFYGW